jgi:uncharacterized protein YdeI (YjbR/CyaY-like superfamily)
VSPNPSRFAAKLIRVGGLPCVHVQDEAPQPPPADLAAALARVEHGPAIFDRLPPGMRREILAWLAAAKQPATRETRIERVLETLADRERGPR